MYKIELYIQCRTNRKSYGLSNGVIFNDLERPLPRFDAEYLRNGTKYRHSFNGILIGLTHFLVNIIISNDLSVLAKNSMT